MPRIAKPATEDVNLARQALEAYLKHNKLAASHLAKAARVGQPTVSRFLSGRTKTLTHEVRRLLEYAGIREKSAICCINLDVGNLALSSALRRHWDGSDASAEVLARLIEAVAPALNSMRARALKERK